jgi:fibronectin type 3 domain-containing protein
MLKRISTALAAVALAALVSCSNDHGSEPGPFDLEYPSTPTGLTVTPAAEQATIEWEYPAEEMASIEEFRVYYYFPSLDVVELVTATTDLSYVDTKLVGNVEYCYKVSAVDLSGVEGWRSESECALIETR